VLLDKSIGTNISEEYTTSSFTVAPKLVAVCASKILPISYKFTRCHASEDHNIYFPRHGNKRF
jgi:hypothetical protein